jgi:hypothetical protein
VALAGRSFTVFSTILSLIAVLIMSTILARLAIFRAVFPSARRRSSSVRDLRWSAICGGLSIRPPMNHIRAEAGFKCL